MPASLDRICTSWHQPDGTSKVPHELRALLDAEGREPEPLAPAYHLTDEQGRIVALPTATQLCPVCKAALSAQYGGQLDGYFRDLD